MTPVALSAGRRRFVLGSMPFGSRIVRADYFRDEYLPCPIRIVARTPRGGASVVVLRITGHGPGGVRREARLLPAVAGLGLPVPHVRRGPVRDPDGPRSARMALLEYLPGRSLQALSLEGSAGLSTARRLLVEAAIRLESISARLAATTAGRGLPRVGLGAMLGTLTAARGPWWSNREFRSAAAILRPVLAGIRERSGFVNGDLQPANFLARGGRLTGYLDFEQAVFRDPLFGFAKYAIYDLAPLNRGGAIAAYLAARGFTDRDFAPRLALGCLLTLDREIAPAGGTPHLRAYRAHVVGLLRRALAVLRGARLPVAGPRAWWLPQVRLVD